VKWKNEAVNEALFEMPGCVCGMALEEARPVLGGWPVQCGVYRTLSGRGRTCKLVQETNGTKYRLAHHMKARISVMKLAQA